MKNTVVKGIKGFIHAFGAFVNSLLLYILYSFIMCLPIIIVTWGVLLLFNAPSSITSLFSRIGLSIGLTVAVVVAVGEADKTPNSGNSEAQRYVAMTAWLCLLVALWAL